MLGVLHGTCTAAGNGGSLDKCRRRWDLCDNPGLRYQSFLAFDRAMCHLEKAFGFTCAPHQVQLHGHREDLDGRDGTAHTETGSIEPDH